MPIISTLRLEVFFWLSASLFVQIPHLPSLLHRSSEGKFVSVIILLLPATAATAATAPTAPSAATTAAIATIAATFTTAATAQLLVLLLLHLLLPSSLVG